MMILSRARDFGIPVVQALPFLSPGNSLASCTLVVCSVEVIGQRFEDSILIGRGGDRRRQRLPRLQQKLLLTNELITRGENDEK